MVIPGCFRSVFGDLLDIDRIVEVGSMEEGRRGGEKEAVEEASENSLEVVQNTFAAARRTNNFILGVSRYEKTTTYLISLGPIDGG
jgi:hypothetical protein